MHPKHPGVQHVHVALLLGVGSLLASACGGGITNPDIVKTGDTDLSTESGFPHLLLSDDALDFGRVKIGGSAAESIAVTNTGNGVLEIYAFTLSVAGEFVVLADGGLSIPPQGSAGITIKYLPIDYARDDVWLTISSNDEELPEARVRLEGASVTDVDGDGYDGLEAGGDDCNDDDPDIHPGADDEWYDGEDSNCDGADDYDQDGDGYQTALYNDEVAGGGGDCQDNNPTMHPYADDEWYDGIDSDCDGSNDFDQDGDGFDALSGGGDDCDDLDPSVNPDNNEKLNGLDDDCNGWADDSIPGWNADRRYPGNAAGAYGGFAITMGDLDDDGDEDLIVGSYGANGGQGAVSVIDGGSPKPDGTALSSAHHYMAGSGASDQFGYSVAFLSLSGAFPEPYLAIGAPNGSFGYGAVYLLTGDDARAGGAPSSAAYVISGAGGTNGYYVGRGLSQDVDLDGDGSVDLLGFYRTSTSTTAAPNVWLFYGDTWDAAFTGTATLADADARFSTDGGGGGSYNSRMQWNFARGGDGDGDGYTDFMFCDYMSDVVGTNDGAMWLLWGQSGRYSNSSATNIESYGDIIATTSQYDKGQSLCDFVGDLDGDGDDEVAGYTINAKKLHIWDGGSDLGNGVLREGDALITYEFSASSAEAGSLRSLGDLSGDGIPEIGVGLGSGGSTAGSLYVFDGSLTGDLDADDDAYSVIEGDSDYDNGVYGNNINSRSGDWNGDGAVDLIVGDYGYGGATAANKGSVFVTFGN